LLASWGIGIISLVLLMDFWSRTFHWSNISNRQYIATSPESAYFVANSLIDRMSLHVDLGSVAGGQRLSSVLWNAAKKAMSVSSAINRVAALCLDVFFFLWNWLVLPLFRKGKAGVLFIWQSPVLCSATTVGLMYLLFAHHSGRWRWGRLEHFVVSFKSILIQVGVEAAIFCWQNGMAAFSLLVRFLRLSAAVTWAVVKNTQGQLVAACQNGDVASPRLAWVVWGVQGDSVLKIMRKGDSPALFS
jgi:hypothetical protein